MILFESGLHHQIQCGTIQTSYGKTPHFWISLEDGYVIDYRARMWLKNRRDLLHGVFKPINYTEVDYTSKVLEHPHQQDEVVKILARLEGINYEEIITAITAEINSLK